MSRKKKKAIVFGPANRQPIVVVETTQKKKKKKNRKRNRKAGVSSSSPLTRLKQSYAMMVMAPDLVGPHRQPRAGLVRSGLAIDVTDFAIVGSAVNTVQGVQANTVFGTNCMVNWAVATEATVLGAGVLVQPGSVFPATTQIADINLVAISIVAYYIGNPLNVTGEVLMGTALPLASTAQYQGMFFYPGAIKFPVADLITRPKRVFARKLSPASDEFLPVASGNPDIDLPYFLTSGLPTNGTVKVVMTRTYEYRSTTASSNIIPYESITESFSQDLDAFQDVRADLASAESTISDALPSEGGASLQDYLGYGTMGGIGALGSGYAVLNGAKRIFDAFRGNPRTHVDPGGDRMIPFERYLRLNANSRDEL